MYSWFVPFFHRGIARVGTWLGRWLRPGFGCYPFDRDRLSFQRPHSRSYCSWSATRRGFWRGSFCASCSRSESFSVDYREQFNASVSQWERHECCIHFASFFQWFLSWMKKNCSGMIGNDQTKQGLLLEEFIHSTFLSVLFDLRSMYFIFFPFQFWFLCWFYWFHRLLNTPTTYLCWLHELWAAHLSSRAFPVVYESHLRDLIAEILWAKRLSRGFHHHWFCWHDPPWIVLWCLYISIETTLMVNKTTYCGIQFAFSTSSFKTTFVFTLFTFWPPLW